jgi:hypothetical protein
VSILLLVGAAVRGDIGGDFSELEGQVTRNPSDLASRRDLAEAYAARGFTEEAVAQYFAILKQQPSEGQARERAAELIRQHMPQWLPPEAEEISPFAHAVSELTLPDPVTKKPVTHRLLRTTEAFHALGPGDGVLTDPVHQWHFSGVGYGYAWDARASRWVMKVRVCSDPAAASRLADDALIALLCFYEVARDYARCDPTRPDGEPIALWLTAEGKPGGESVGRNLYLTAVNVPRAPTEWLREIAHEYGHICLPGMGGFTKTADPWVDGDLGELLLSKWLAATSQPSGLTWQIRDAEDTAAARRRSLVSKAIGKPDPARLRPSDGGARDYFLGLVLRVEENAGPRFLAEALGRCPRGKPADFITAADALAKEHALNAWSERVPAQRRS